MVSNKKMVSGRHMNVMYSGCIFISVTVWDSTCRCVDVAQVVSEDSRVRQGDSKALVPGLWDHYCLACYISCRVSQAESKRCQKDLQIHSQTQVRWRNKRNCLLVYCCGD